ncbi:MAG: WD40 repeat domain-containing protein, partial [Gemmataceae bacterium]|nr:WD40 repeat domain-containing protein [Gemmataceae bacterium]
MVTRSIFGSVLIGLIGFHASPASPPPVAATAYRPDGQWLAAGHGRKVTLIHREGSTREVLLALRVTALAWSPDGRLLAVASGQPGKSGSIHIHAVGDDGQVSPRLGPILAHDDLIHALAFSPDGNTLASCSYDRFGKLWSVADGSLVRPLKDHSDAVYAIAWSPDGRRIATVAADRTVKLWDSATGHRLVSLNDPTDWVYAVAWSPDGKHLAAAGVDRSIRVWDVSAAEPRLARSAFAHEKAIIHLVFTQDGSALFSLSEDRTVKAWNSGNLTEQRVYPAQPEAVLSLALRPDGKNLALGRYDGALIVLDRESGQVVAQPLPEKPKPPKLARIEPDHIVRGGRQTIALRGEHLGDDVELLISSPNIKFTKGQSGAEPATEVRYHLEAASSVEPGLISIRVKTAGGESNALPFYVDRFPAVAEPPGTEIPRSAPQVAVDTTIVGELSRAGQVDYYRLRLDAGQELGVQVRPISGSKLEAVLTCIDANGQRLAVSSSGALGFVAPSAGEYIVTVQDREYRGGAEYGYRLHLGRIPIVTSVTPLGIGRGQTVNVEVRGVFLDGEKTRTVQAPPDAVVGSRIPVPISSSLGQVLQAPSLLVGAFPHVALGQAIPIPGSGQGVIDQPGASQEWTFTAKQGDAVIIEVEARRLGSDLDSMIEVLDSHGHPVEQAVLRSVARTFVTFRDHDSTSPGIRMEAWNEFAIDDYVWVGQELMRIRALPRNPDDDCQFYAVDGQRVGYLGTTPTHHAFNTPMYKVTVPPPGSKFPPNGMPLVTLTYRNDDGGPGYGKDSRLRFTAPADGQYLSLIHIS